MWSLSKKLSVGINRASRYLKGTNGRVLHEYLRSHEILKLHIGCGKHTINGWLNCDHYPKSSEIFRLEATARFPFESGMFRYIFSEHMIEHIRYEDFLGMLAECHRVLQPLGKIRLATPNLRFLIELCSGHESSPAHEFMKWFIDKNMPCASSYEGAFVINRYMRSWDHQFIYDESTLRSALEKGGFSEITRYAVLASADQELGNLENVGRKPEGFLRMETLVLEGTKPETTIG